MWNPVCRACRVCFASRAKIDSHACRSVHSFVLLSICLDSVYLPICPPLYLADTCRENLILGVLLCEVGRATSIVWTAKTTPVYSSLAWHAAAKQHTCTNRRCNQSFHCLLMIVPMSSLHLQMSGLWKEVEGCRLGHGTRRGDTDNLNMRTLQEAASWGNGQGKLLQRVFPKELLPNSTFHFIHTTSSTSFTSPISPASTSCTSQPSFTSSTSTSINVI